VCAKDEQHTLWSSTLLDANLVGTSAVRLDGGDTDNDGDVDINDVTFFIADFGLSAAAGGCPWDGVTRDADFDNNGTVDAIDFPFISDNWLRGTSCACGVPAQGAATVDISRVSLSVETGTLRPEIARRADLNSDGVVDVKDVEAFETRHGLPHTLSTVMRRDVERRREANTKSQRPTARRGR